MTSLDRILANSESASGVLNAPSEHSLANRIREMLQRLLRRPHQGSRGAEEFPDSKRTITPEQRNKCIAELESRFNTAPDHYVRPKNAKWTEVKAALEEAPDYLIWSLIQMNEPDVVKVTREGFIFAECPKLSGHTNMTYPEALKASAEMGLRLTNEDLYRSLQDLAKKEGGGFDLKSIDCWIDTPEDISKQGDALVGRRDGFPENTFERYFERNHVVIRPTFASHNFENRGWRGYVEILKA